MSIFSRWRTRHCVGVELCGEQLYWAQISGRAGCWRLTDLGCGMPGNLSRWRGCRIAMSVPSSQSMRRELEVGEGADERDVLAQIDLSLAELFAQRVSLATDFRYLTTSKVEVYAIRVQQLARFQAWAAAYKLRLSCIEPESLALERVLAQQQQPCLLIHGRMKSLTVLLWANQQLVLNRQVDVSLLPHHELILEGILPKMILHQVRQIYLSGDIPPALIKVLEQEASVDFFNPFDGAEERSYQFMVALGLAIGEMYAAH